MDWRKSAVVARGPRLVPLASLRIVQTQGQTLDLTAAPSASNSSRFARPFQILLTTVVPSYSVQLVDPVTLQASYVRPPRTDL